MFDVYVCVCVYVRAAVILISRVQVSLNALNCTRTLFLGMEILRSFIRSGDWEVYLKGFLGVCMCVCMCVYGMCMCGVCVCVCMCVACVVCVWCVCVCISVCIHILLTL